MSRHGFWIADLKLSGPHVLDAEVHFSRGLNVISGPSDTGKTYIAQCIDFLFGATRLPDIPQAGDYDKVSMSVVSVTDNDSFNIERSLRGGDLRMRTNGSEKILGARHKSGSEDTISYFLLEKSGLAGRKIQTDINGKTRELSFRDIVRLIVIDEEKIISRDSPIHSGQVITRTGDASVLRMLLTDVDDSAVLKRETRRVTRQRDAIRIELLDELETRVREQIAELQITDDPPSIRIQLDRVEKLFDQASDELSTEQQGVAEIEERRRSTWTQVRAAESRAGVLAELQARFELLMEQYASDLRRLEAISEAGLRLGQLKEERCPLCGALPEHHDQEHQAERDAPQTVGESCRAEAEKIRSLMSDLGSTVTQNTTEIERLTSTQRTQRYQLRIVNEEFRARVEPRLQAAIQKLRDSQSQRDKYRQAIELYDRLQELEDIRNRPVEPQMPSDSLRPTLPAREIEEFCAEIEEVLKSWNFPNLSRVTFSETDQDIVISGERRASHGKGVRAITHAAFNIALLRYATRRSQPHPGLVVVDSPLVVYREPDPDEDGFAPDVKDAFFRSLATHFEDGQVIILENVEPPSDIEPRANLIHFTGSDVGRRGFIP